MLSLCVNCKGYLISHGWKNCIKVTVASIDQPEKHPNDDEVRDHVKQTWEKVKIDLTSDDDEAREQDDENVEMGDGEEEVDDEEEEDLDMGDLNAEKRDFGEKDKVDNHINREVKRLRMTSRRRTKSKEAKSTSASSKRERCKMPWNILHG